MNLPAGVDRETPLRLRDALALAFPMGGMTVSGLRKERDRGTLETYVFAGRQFTTLGAIDRMKEQCRVQPSRPASGSAPRSAAPTEPSRPNGSSSTEETSIALAAARMRVERLRERSRSTSRASTSRRDASTVIPLRS